MITSPSTLARTVDNGSLALHPCIFLLSGSGHDVCSLHLGLGWQRSLGHWLFRAGALLGSVPTAMSAQVGTVLTCMAHTTVKSSPDSLEDLRKGEKSAIGGAS